MSQTVEELRYQLEEWLAQGLQALRTELIIKS